MNSLLSLLNNTTFKRYVYMGIFVYLIGVSFALIMVYVNYLGEVSNNRLLTAGLAHPAIVRAPVITDKKKTTETRVTVSTAGAVITQTTVTEETHINNGGSTITPTTTFKTPDNPIQTALSRGFTVSAGVFTDQQAVIGAGYDISAKINISLDYKTNGAAGIRFTYRF